MIQKTHRLSRGKLLIRILALLLLGCLASCNASGNEAIEPEPFALATGTNELAEETPSEFIIAEEIIIGLLLIAAVVGIVTRRLRVPYTVGLVFIGLALALRGRVDIEVTPELFLGLLVPPLIFEAAFHLRATDLRRDLTPILALAIPGVLITTFLVGYVVAWGTGFPIEVALVFGALVAATDPVAVIALFRSLGVPKRLQVLLEGESLFNDGTAIVIFHLMITIVITRQFSVIESVLDFIVVSGGGLLIGLFLGMVVSQIIKQIDDPLIETTLTVVLAFGSYLIAEEMHVSGVLAVVAAGLISGNIGPQGMSPSTRILVFNFWEIAAFVANSFVFLLIGLQIDIRAFPAAINAILWALLAVLVARAVSVYGLSWIGPGMPTRFKHVLLWGGLRGAISLALALSLPAGLGPYREDLQIMAFGVVLFTLLVQGLSMRPMIRRMNIIQRSDSKDEFELSHARAVIANAAYERLKRMYQGGLLSAHIWSLLSAPLEKRSQLLARAATEALRNDPTLEAEELDSALKELLLTQRSTLTALLRDGIISEEAYTKLVGEIDTALIEPRTDLIEFARRRDRQPIRSLMTVVVQEQDVENAMAALSKFGVSITRMPSVGSFLDRENATLLIAVPKGKEAALIKTLSETSKQRIEFLLAENYEAISQDTSVAIGGAAIFTLDVERYEEL